MAVAVKRLARHLGFQCHVQSHARQAGLACQGDAGVNSFTTSGFVTFPMAFRGRTVTDRRARGILYGAIRSLAHRCNASSVSASPEPRSSTAAQTSPEER